MSFNSGAGNDGDEQAGDSRNTGSHQASGLEDVNNLNINAFYDPLSDEPFEVVDLPVQIPTHPWCDVSALDFLSPDLTKLVDDLIANHTVVLEGNQCIVVNVIRLNSSSNPTLVHDPLISTPNTLCKDYKSATAELYNNFFNVLPQNQPESIFSFGEPDNDSRGLSTSRQLENRNTNTSVPYESHELPSTSSQAGTVRRAPKRNMPATSQNTNLTQHPPKKQRNQTQQIQRQSSAEINRQILENFVPDFTPRIMVEPQGPPNTTHHLSVTEDQAAQSTSQASRRSERIAKSKGTQSEELFQDTITNPRPVEHAESHGQQLPANRQKLKKSVESLRKEREAFKTENVKQTYSRSPVALWQSNMAYVKALYEKHVLARTEKNGKFWVLAFLFYPLLASLIYFLFSNPLNLNVCSINDLKVKIVQQLRYVSFDRNGLAKIPTTFLNEIHNSFSSSQAEQHPNLQHTFQHFNYIDDS